MAVVRVEKKMMLPMRGAVAGVVAVAVETKLSLVWKNLNLKTTLVEEVVELAEVEAEVVQPFLSCVSLVHFVTKETTHWPLLEEEEAEEVVAAVVLE